jgi:hypothetical protein
MNVIVFEKESYYKMLSEVITFVKNEVTKSLKSSETRNKDDDWISPEEAKKLLEVRSKTKMQQLRNSNEIQFAKYGRKIKYSRDSIIKFLNRNKQAFL